MNPKAQQQEPQTELRIWQHCAVFLLACAVIVARRPDAIFHAQFWTEDGHVFFADAYNYGWWHALFRMYEGYFHAFPRLAASLALLVPLSLAPLVLNVISIGIHALPANLLLSFRSSAWGSLRFRAILAGIFLALPNNQELSTGIAQAQWHLALCAFLLLVASAPKSVAGRLFDTVVLGICGLTGPFCIFLFPIALILVWKRSPGWRWVPAGILAACCLTQALGLLNGGFSGRPHYALGASAGLFARILGGQVFLGTLVGSNGLAAAPSQGIVVFLVLVAVGGTAILAICFARTFLEMRLFILFSFMVLVASLISPTAYPPAGLSIWGLLAGAPDIRYWYLPGLAFAWSILWCSRSSIPALRGAAVFLLFLMCFGIVRDWRSPAYDDLHFAEYAKLVEAAPAGTVVTIPENPKGWNLQLITHQSLP